jgi:plasmid stabilization system protein ParE
MSRLIWSPQALLDVQRLYRFLADKNTDAAKRAVRTLRTGVKALGHQPGIGRPIADMADEFREWVIDFGDSGYVVRYRIGADVVTVLAVRHQKEVGF